MKRLYLVLFFLLLILFSHTDVSAQCVMCKEVAEDGIKNGQTTSAGLNSGILYLLAMPYLSFAAIGFLWWKNYKKKQAQGEV